MSNTVKLNTCPQCQAPIPAAAPQGLCPKCVLRGAATATEQGVPATATSEIPSIERISKAFPQLEVLELIGRGGMGFVFKARQPHLDRFVALKLLPDKLAKDPQFAERFNREGRVLAKLNHPNIVSVFDFGQTGGFYYLTMEYVDGVNLRQAMRAGRFSPAEALSIVPKVCEALQYAHEQGILHRDIKPENILLDAKGRVKIADFGIAKLVGEDQPNITLTNTGAALGTPHYMAPEQLEKPATVDHRADIYSLGVVFYEMLTGELPIGRFAAPSAKTPVNTTVDDVVFRTLEKDRERRFQSAGEMKTQVEHLGAGSFEQPEAEDDADDEAPRSWLEAVYSKRLVGWFLAAFCLVNFAFPHVTRLGSSTANTYSFGFSRPWLVNVPLVDNHNVVTREWRFNSSTTSFGTGMFGLALMAALLVLRHRVRTAPAVPRGAARISSWSIYGAISVGLSLPAPMKILVALLTGIGGVGPGELWLTLGSVALPGLGGTLLGWLALNEIRESRGRVKGLPLAMFATLFWPLTILGAVTIGVPMFLLVPGGEPSVARTFGRFLVLLLPAAVIAFGFWTIHATARWASQQQVAQQRGLLKWVFIVVLVVGMGVVLVSQPGKRDGVKPAPLMFVSGTPVEQTSDSPESLRANFRFAKGHVVTFQAMRRVGDDAYEPVPNFAGYAVAPDDERGRFSLTLVPDSANLSTNPRTWRIRLESEGGGSAGGPSAPLGELISMLPTNHFHEMESDASFGLYLTRAYQGAETNGITPLEELSLDVRSVPRGKVGVGPQNTLLSVGSTNWIPALKQLAKAKPVRRAQPGEVLASQWLKSPVGTNTTNWIRFTFTNVELRNENDQQWLAMGYLTDVHGDCEEVFAVDATGFKAVTRKTGWRTTPAGSPPIEYSGIQWLVPPDIDAATLESFRDSVADALVAKSFVIPEGEQRPLIRFPIGKAGILSVGIGARLRLGFDRDAQAGHRSMQSNMNETVALPNASFGPEKEITLTTLFAAGGQLALDRKELVEAPPGAQQWGRPKLLLWLAEQGVDLAVLDYGDDEQLGWGLAMRPTTSRIDKPWPAIDTQAVKNALASPDLGLEYMDAAGDQMKLYRFYPTSAPLSFAIRTRSGRLAALQIIGINENPRGVKIRYKLEQTAINDASTSAVPMIQFTFTNVELREVEGSRGLAMDCASQVQGDCEHKFRIETKGLKYSAQIFTMERRTETKAGFAPVRYQQVIWRLPESLPSADAMALRDQVAKEWTGKSVTVEPGGQRALFKASVPDGGTLTGFVEVKLVQARP